VDQVLKFIVAMSLACIAGMFIAEARAADAFLSYNPERDGEGATIFTDEGKAVMVMYTYTDNSVVMPPTVSPYLPEYVAVECLNSPIWFLGVSEDWDGISGSGDLTINRPFQYPASVDGQVSEPDTIGKFFLLRDADGFDLFVDWVRNDAFPFSVSLYDTVYQLHVPVVKVSGN
jgi:hypothetical protein